MTSASAARTPRGVRNNNPGNIRRARGQHWLGQRDPGTDPDFVQFETPELGIRALARLLLSYERRYKISTIEAAIHRFAPPSENDTERYVHFVARRANLAPTEPITFADYDTLRAVVVAIIAYECAGWEYPPEVVDRGIWAALGAEPEQDIPRTIGRAARTDTGRGAIAASVTTGAGAIATVMGGLADLDWRVAIAAIVAIAVTATVVVLYWRSRRE